MKLIITLITISTIFNLNAMKVSEQEMIRDFYRQQRINNRNILLNFIKSKKNPNQKISFHDHYSFKDEYPLVFALKEECFDSLHQLLENGADPNLGNPLGHLINKSGFLDGTDIISLMLIGQLLKYGANPTKDDVKLMQTHIEKSNSESEKVFCIQLLDKHRTIVQQKGLKELALRTVIINQLHITHKKFLPVDLQEAAEKYSQREDMIHHIKWQ